MIKKIVTASIFAAVTAWLIYKHIENKKHYEYELAGMEKLTKGLGKKTLAEYDRYATLENKRTKSLKGVVIPYRFTVEQKAYKGNISGINKEADELIRDSVIYLSEDPSVNSLIPEYDYTRLKNDEPGNWRLYIAIFTGLGIIGSFMDDKKEKQVDK